MRAIQNQIQNVLDKYPNLSLEPNGTKISGYLSIGQNDTDKYLLEMDISGFPETFPLVWEVGERIPRKADRHTNNNGTLCFTTQSKADIYLKAKVHTLLDFVDLILIPYFQNNSFYEINGYYKFGEHSHHFLIAIVESYQDILGVNDIYLLAKIIKSIIEGKKIRPNEICYCGSNKKIKNCSSHQENFRKAKLIKRDTLIRDFSFVRSVLLARLY